MDYIDLNRHFASPKQNDNEYSYLDYLGGSKTTWVDLLQHECVVVLGGAGSGKTEEFQQQVINLNTSGKFALFFAIEELAGNSLEDCLSLSEEQKLASWFSSGETGYFFLDSVDEAKLKSKNDFIRALRKLSKMLGNHINRSHVYISCRPSDWDYKADKKIVEKFFAPQTPLNQRVQDYSLSEMDRRKLLLEPILRDDDEITEVSSKKPKDRQIEVFKITPLSADQLGEFSKTIIGEKHTNFSTQLEQQGLEEYTKHPGDLIQLIEYWRAHGEFSTLTKMTEHFIKKQLTDKSHREDGNLISESEAWDGAKRLALALILGKKFTIKTSDYEESSDNIEDTKNHINPELVLSDWTAAKREALLRRAIFSPAAFGRVRFKHRKMIEFLSAKAFDHILKSHEGRQKVTPVFFKQEFGVDTIPKEIRPVIAWVAQWHNDIMQKIIQCEPMVLIRFGDAKSLKIETRKKLLEKLSQLHSKGDVAYEMSEESSAIWAFADVELATEIRNAWKENPFWRFRYMLLQMISAAKITELGDLADSVVSPRNKDFSLAVSGVETLVLLGDEARLKKIAKALVSSSKPYPVKKCPSLCSLLYPKFVSTNEVLLLVEKAKTPKKYSGRGFSYMLPNLLRSCPNEDIENFLVGISELALRPPYEQDYRPISKKYGYLAHDFENAAHIVLDRIDPSKISFGLANILVAQEHTGGSNTIKRRPLSINDRLSDRPLQKAEYFLADIGFARSKQKKKDLDGRPWCRIPHHWMWKIGSSDFDWIITLVNDPSRADYENDTAYYLWLEQTQRNSCFDEHFAELKKYATTKVRKEWLERALQPKKKQEWEKRQEENRLKKERQQKIRKAKSGASWVEFDRKIQKAPPAADYSGGVNDTNWYLIDNLSQWLSHRVNKHKSEAPRYWQQLKPAYGEKIANLYYDHLKALWRNIPHKRTVWKKNNGTTCLFSLYAFAGIGAESDADPEWASKLSEQEAKQACEHLVRAGNGKTNWMDDLLKHHKKVLLPLLRAELKRTWISSDEHPNSWMSYFTRDVDGLPDEMLKLAKSVFIHNKPGTLRNWDDGLRLLKQVSLTSAQLKKFKRTAEKLSQESSDNLGGKIRYLCSLFIHDFDQGLSELEDELHKANPKEREAILGSLFDGRHSGLIPDVLNNAIPTSLEKAIKVAFKYIKPKDDIEHEGTYSPGRRDHAESARSTIVGALLAQKNEGAYLAIRRLANDKSITENHHWYNVLSKGMVEKMASLDGWSEVEVSSFLNGFDAPVKNQKEFFEQSRTVIDGIIYDLNSDDGTSRQILLQAKIEDDVRDWLLERLKDRSAARYHALKEPEVDDKKMPDIVMASMSVPVQCAIELKHGDQPHCGSIRKMKKAIKAQLIDKYLKPTDRRAGLFIVSHHYKSYWVHPTTKKRMQFREVIEHLKEYTKQLQRASSVQIYIDVVGIECNKI